MLSLERQNALREQYRADNPGWQPATEVYAAWVRARCRPNSRLLDVGCGRGGLVEQLGHPLDQVVGVDPDWASLREHRLQMPRVAGLSERLPFAAATFDLSFASWVLEHLAQPQADLAALRRVSRPGGHFLFITPNVRHPLLALNRGLGRLGRLQRALVARLYGRAGADTFPAYYRANSAAAVAQLANRTGWQVTAWAAVSDPTYLAFTPALYHLLTRLERRLPVTRRLHVVGCLTAN